MHAIKGINPDINFHDSAILRAEFVDGLYKLQVTIYAPNAGPDWDRGRFYRLTFSNLLRLELEVSGPGMPSGPVEAYEIYLKEDKEYQRWRGARGARPVYHIMLASSTVRGWGSNEDLEGVSIVCEAYEIDDVTAQWPDEFRTDPGVIPGAKEERATGTSPPRRARKKVR